MTSLEVSKELWERELRVDSYFYWTKDIHNPDFPDCEYMIAPFRYEVIEGEYPSYLLHELLDIMERLHCHRHKIDHIADAYHYHNERFNQHTMHETYGNNSADAVGRCLIYLIENGYVQIKDGKVVVE